MAHNFTIGQTIVGPQGGKYKLIGFKQGGKYLLIKHKDYPERIINASLFSERGYRVDMPILDLGDIYGIPDVQAKEKIRRHQTDYRTEYEVEEISEDFSTQIRDFVPPVSW